MIKILNYGRKQKTIENISALIEYKYTKNQSF